ncbi:SUF system NifU family Fe-S cluster assembly protein [soil metagenome]
MSVDLKKLYSEIIKTHQSSPYHFEKRVDAGVSLKAYNPICGDKFEFYFELSTNDQQPLTINDFFFYGFGCAISKSSSSIMVKSMIGKSSKEALNLCKKFLGFINDELTGKDLILPDEFLAFSGVRDFPERIECATLAWKEMEKFLEAKEKLN